ncbi:ubiquitin thioesterase OTUB1, variant 1 [Cladophialophora carrionii]|uniref:ubiquitinyl hydrolase 1 n=1 Tax=Cladophialophora carrionii TaxID=86049 RepID=A0A1C1CU28_9EURO|nr:ubiquitin thioesterase OTUB1, variant 1 [Cladophialophora carrionii]
MATPDVDEMEQFQQLSDHYQPSLPGPLIGSRKPLSELVTEYSQADPTYVAKTKVLSFPLITYVAHRWQALEATHSAYRRIKGDGQCGWRGAVFGYFEILLQSRDFSLVAQEEVRLRSHEQTMRAAGIDYDIITDMFDYTWELFGAIKSATERGDVNETVLLQSLNDENISNSIVYHFKMMTSAFMELNPDRYKAFLEMSVQQYRLTRIDPSNQEIDHVGLQALTDAVIAPAYIAVEVSYLDRSTGDEVTAYQFVDNAKGWPTIRLIYRPGHYDIIYKDDHRPVHHPQPLQVYLQTDVPQYIPAPEEGVFRSGNTDVLGELSFLFPNAAQTGSATSMSYPNNHAFSSGYQPQPPLVYSQRTTPQNSYFPELPQTVFHATIPQHPPPPVRTRSLPQQGYSSTTTHLTPQISPSPQSPQPPSPVTPTSVTTNRSIILPKSAEPQIRYNENCFQYSIEKNKSIPLDPATFGSAALSPAHFSNSNFQPVIWSPEEEYSKRD